MSRLSRLSWAFCALVVTAMLAGPVWADVILDAPIIARASDAGNPSGDGPDTGSGLDNGSGTAILAGDSSGDILEFRTLFLFDITANTADIESAATITFSLTIARSSGPAILGDLGAFDLVALTAGEDNGSLAATDYAIAGSVVKTFDVSLLTEGETIEVDVTAAVQADAGVNPYTGFRLQASDPDAFNDDDSTADLVFFGTIGDNDAALTIVPVPEPASLMLIGVGTAMSARRRKA